MVYILYVEMQVWDNIQEVRRSEGHYVLSSEIPQGCQSCLRNFEQLFLKY
jgi:hypothetical protein